LPPILDPDPVKIYIKEVPCNPLPTWFGVPCRFVQARMGLPILGSPVPRVFSLLALLPAREIEDMPPFLRLGAEFFATNDATLSLPWDKDSGELVIP
jgi:hypothetical protein